LGPGAHIETIGACATLIWEEFKRRQPDKKISPICANLISTAIFSNTLNFQASVTTERDRTAFRELKSYINLPENWFEQYYQEIESEIYRNPAKSILNDTKTIEIKGVKYTVGQIELWKSRNFIVRYFKEIVNTLAGFGNPNWFFTSPSISEGKTYIYTKDEAVKRRLKEILDLTFEGNFGTTNKLWLRKEILKKLQN
jgi:inorganic pyrophosphatase/exopolyphosphatase